MNHPSRIIYFRKNKPVVENKMQNKIFYAASLALILSIAFMPMLSGWAMAEETDVTPETVAVQEEAQVEPINTESTTDSSDQSLLGEENNIEEGEQSNETESSEENSEEGLSVPACVSKSEILDQEVEATENTELVSTQNCKPGNQITGEVESEPKENTTETDSEIDNTNTANVENNSSVDGNSGSNNSASETQTENSIIDSGNVTVYANVLNILNNNQVNSKLVQVTENFNNLSANILMNYPETQPANMAQSLVNNLCDNVQCQSLTSIKFTNNNSAKVHNNVTANGNSGNNTIQNASSGSEIRTGNVNALVNIVNIVNSNLVNSTWTIATFNVFGDWQGDLELPSELYFAGSESIGATNADQALSQVSKVVLQVNNINEANISNNVKTNASAGDNIINGNNVSDGSIQTGESVSVSNTKNVVNTILINQDWFLSMVNIIGQWTGSVYYMPNQVSMEQTALGMTFAATNSNNSVLNAQFNDVLSELGSGEILVQVENNNTAEITNDVDLNANSGGNKVEGQDTVNSKITTGYARALSNILNFANVNLVNSNLHVGFLNIFGNWKGNVVFGYPDLTVTQNLLQGNVPNSNGQRVNYEISYANTSGTAMPDAILYWHFEPDKYQFQYGSVSGITLEKDGFVQYKIGKLAANAAGKIQVQLLTKQNLMEGHPLTVKSEIYGNGPEKNIDNNFHSLVSTVSSTWNDVPELPNPNPVVQTAPIYVSTDNMLLITKTNDSEGRELRPGEQVTFKIVIENKNWARVPDAAVIDVLFGPDGKEVVRDEQKLGDILAQEVISYEYTLHISEKVSDGVYTNKAWIEGYSSNYQPLKTVEASSTFTVKNDLLTYEPVIESAQSDNPPVVKKLSQSVRKQKSLEFLPPLVLGAETIINEPSEENFSPNIDTSAFPQGKQDVITFAIVGGAAFMYAAYKFLQRTWL